LYTFGILCTIDTSKTAQPKQPEKMKTKLAQILISTFTVAVATLAIVADLNPLMILGLFAIAFGAIITR
jgi:hypothetical protein